MFGTKRPLSSVAGDLFESLSLLVQDEARLARAEIRENISTGLRCLVLALAGAILMLPAAVILLEAIAALLVRGGLPDYLAGFIVALVAAAIAAALILTAKNRLKRWTILPDKTINQLRRDVDVARSMRQDHENERAA